MLKKLFLGVLLGLSVLGSAFGEAGFESDAAVEPKSYRCRYTYHCYGMSGMPTAYRARACSHARWAAEREAEERASRGCYSGCHNSSSCRPVSSTCEEVPNC